MIRKSNSFTWLMIVFVLSLLVFSGINIGVNVWAINQSQHRWCAVLTTIKPRNISDNNRPFFQRLNGLENQFGCEK